MNNATSAKANMAKTKDEMLNATKDKITAFSEDFFGKKKTKLNK